MNQVAENQEEPFVSINAVAKHFAISKSTIRSWVRTGRIPSDTYFKLGNTYRFRLGAITDALLNQELATNEDVVAETPTPDLDLPDVSGSDDEGADEDI